MNKIKKLISVLVCAAMVLAVPPCMGVSAATSGKCGNNLTWSIDSTGTLTIRGTGPMWDYEPDMFEKTSKCSPWHYSKAVRFVIVGNGVTSIGNGAFYSCSNLEDVILPDSLTHIGMESFEFCDKLQTIDIPNNVSTIDEAAFFCSGIINIELPPSIKVIEAGTFYGCDELVSITIPNGVTQICEAAFFGCDKLNNIYLPKSISKIETGAFAACYGLNSLSISEANTNYTVDYPGIVFSKNRNTLVVYPAGLGSTYYAIPDSVEYIYPAAFYGNDYLTEITMPKSLIAIGEASFRSCHSIIRIEIPAGTKTIESHAFYDCESLTEIKLPNTLEKFIFNDGSLYGCDNLTSVIYDGNEEQWIYLVLQSYLEQTDYDASESNEDREQPYLSAANEFRAICSYYGYFPLDPPTKVYFLRSDDQNIRVTINGKMVNFDQPPIMQDGRTLVPVRAVFEAMGYSVEWNNATQTTTITDGSQKVEFKIGGTDINITKYSRSGNATSTTWKTDVPAQIINGRTLVPVRILSEALGYDVQWDNYSRTVALQLPKMLEITKKLSEKANRGDEIKIGIITLIQHEALDKALVGFQDAVERSGFNIVFDLQNALGNEMNAQKIANLFIDEQIDLIFSLTTVASQAVASATEDIPILITCVSDPEEAGLLNNNISGTCDIVPVKEQIGLIKKLVPDVKKVAVIYSEYDEDTAPYKDINGEVLAGEALDELGIDVVYKLVSRNTDIQSMIYSLKDEVEAIYVPEDSGALMIKELNKAAIKVGIPVVCGYEGFVEDGGLITYVIDYYNLGYMTGEMAVDIFNGKITDIGSEPIHYQSEEDLKVIINRDTMEALGIDIPTNLKDRAEYI